MHAPCAGLCLLISHTFRSLFLQRPRSDLDIRQSKARLRETETETNQSNLEAALKQHSVALEEFKLCEDKLKKRERVVATGEQQLIEDSVNNSSNDQEAMLQQLRAEVGRFLFRAIISGE